MASRTHLDSSARSGGGQFGPPATRGDETTHQRSTPVRGTSLTRKRTPLGLYRKPMPRALGGF